MSTLPDHQIRALIARGVIGIKPLLDCDIQPASVDLHLGDHLSIGPRARRRDVSISKDFFDSYWMRPFEFLGAATRECITIPANVTGVLMGKSSIAREGLIVESAGFVDPGWTGDLTLEILNISGEPYELIPGMPIAQIRFDLMASPAERPYGHKGLHSHYQGSVGPVMSRRIS